MLGMLKQPRERTRIDRHLCECGGGSWLPERCLAGNVALIKNFLSFLGEIYLNDDIHNHIIVKYQLSFICWQ